MMFSQGAVQSSNGPVGSRRMGLGQSIANISTLVLDAFLLSCSLFTISPLIDLQATRRHFRYHRIKPRKPLQSQSVFFKPKLCVIHSTMDGLVAV